MSQNFEAPDSANGVDNAAGQELDAADNAALDLDPAASDETAEQVETQGNETELEAKPDDEVIDLDEFLSEFEDKPLTRAQIDARFSRVSKEARDVIEKSETARGQALTRLQEIGGDHGYSFAKVVSPHLSNPNPTPQDGDAVFQELADRNPRLLAAMGNLFLNEALNHEATGEETANQIIASEFGLAPDGTPYTLEKLHKLVGYDKADLMDHSEFEKAAKARGLGEPSAREKALEKRLADQDEKIKTLEGKTSSTETAAQEQAKAKADDFIREQIMEPVAPLVDKIGWTVKDTDKPEIKEAKLTLGEMLSAVLQVRSQRTPQWKHYEFLRDNNQAFVGGKPHKLLEAQVGHLGASTKAWTAEIARKIQPLINETLRYKAASRNAKPASEAATKDTLKPSAPSSSKPSNGFNWDDPKFKFDPSRITESIKKVKAMEADKSVRVGQR